MERKTLRWLLAAGITTSVLFSAFTPRIYIGTEPSKFGTALAGRITFGNERPFGANIFIARGYISFGTLRSEETKPCVGIGGGDGIGQIYDSWDNINGSIGVRKPGC